MKLIAALTILLFLPCSLVAASEPDSPRFVHPGILHTQADLQRIKQLATQGNEPWKSAFDLFRASKQAQADYVLRGPVPILVRDPAKNIGKDAMESDVNAAYQNAIMWVITGDESHARKSIQIINAWASTLKQIQGHDAQLAAGLYPFLLTNAAEIIRATDPHWPASDIEQYKRMLHTAVDPVITNFATFANGNWDGACMKMMLAEAVFCDDGAMFNKAIDYYRHGSGNGSIEHYINSFGECQESGRDQAHTQLGLGLLAECCQVAGNQGVNLWDLDDRRLMKGYEYTAAYNLGQDVPFVEYRDTTGKYDHIAISPQSRGKFRSVWEIAFAHFNGIEHLPMPQTAAVLQRIRPEGAPFGADHPGYGTLLFALPGEILSTQP